MLHENCLLALAVCTRRRSRSNECRLTVTCFSPFSPNDILAFGVLSDFSEPQHTDILLESSSAALHLHQRCLPRSYLRQAPPPHIHHLRQTNMFCVQRLKMRSFPTMDLVRPSVARGVRGRRLAKEQRGSRQAQPAD